MINNAADRNQQIADKARAEAFDSVVSQENDEKEGVSTIQANHDKATAEAAASNKEGIEAYNYQRRGTAPAARDSMRFVDTENEGLNGKKYGDRFSLAQQRNQAQFYRAMNTDEVSPAVFTSVQSVIGSIPEDRSDKAPASTYQPYIGAVAYPATRQSLQ